MNRRAVKSFAFPARSNLDLVEREARQARNAELEAAYADAVARGYGEGVARGREEAKSQAHELLENSRLEGVERGHAAGLAAMKQSAQALRDALDAFNLQRTTLIAEVENFCVELALAMVGRIIEADKARAEFVRHSTQSALKALAPEAPTAIFLNAADLKLVARAMSDLPLQEDDTLAPGTARVEAGRLLVESSLTEAFAQVRGAVIEIKQKRIGQNPPPIAAKVHDAI